MRPYHIQIDWIDYNVTNEDDVYKVTIYDKAKTTVITSWATTANGLPVSLSKYLGETS